jgi:tight adherence protein C
MGITLLARAVAMPRVRVTQTLDRIESYGFETQVLEQETESGTLRAAVDSIAATVGSFFSRRASTPQQQELRRELMAAGLYATPLRRFIGYRVLAAVTFTALWVWLASAGGLAGIMIVLGALLIAPLAWWAPIVFVRTRAERRLVEIDSQLPELIDVLVVTVEAGLGFTGSLQVAAERFEGALGDELRLALQEQRMGLSTNEALRNMLARADTPGMRSFVRSILQGETLGVSIGQIMRDLAIEMRKRRRDAAQERAQKAPIKILFPLIFLIFPAMFVILLAPAIFSFVDALGT